jgi:glycosyltransferase 2 family protein
VTAVKTTALERARRALSSLPARAAITAALLAVVAVRVDWHAAAGKAGAIDPQAIVLATVLIAGMQAAGVVRWQLLLRGADIDSPPLRTLRAYWIGIFTNNVLPTGFGGDAARGFIVGRESGRMVPTLTSVAFDRLTGLAALIVLAWATLLLGHGVPSALVAALGTVSAAAAGGAVLAAGVVLGGPRLARFVPARLRDLAREARDTLLAYARDANLLALVALLGLCYQLGNVGAIAALASGLGLDLSFALVAVTVCLVLLASLLPISIAGFGVREGTFVVLLGKAGVSATDATVLSLLSVVPLVLVSLPGGLSLLRPGPRPSAP